MEQDVFDYLKILEQENFHLKNQLKRKNKQIKNLKNGIRSWKKKADQLAPKNSKQHYKNGKRGTKMRS